MATLAAFAFGAIGCATAPEKRTSYAIPADSRPGETLDKWFRGEIDAEEVSVGSLKEAPRGMERLFSVAEIAYWSGDVERAYELYARMIERRPSHPSNRFAAARLYSLRNSVVDYRDRTARLLKETRFDRFEPLARVYLSLAGQTVFYRRWKASDSEEPFRADGLGFPAAWTRTPRMSPWRSIDFDRAFDVESQPTFDEQYISPWFAENRPVNQEETRPYLSGGLSLSPGFAGRGIYYMETFATVEPAKTEKSDARTYWMYGSFSGAAKVWIDGKLAVERKLGNYGTGKRLRRLRLGPGTHRILVKLAYEPGYRDWFDLAFLGDHAGPMGGSKLRFTAEAPESYPKKKGGVEFLGDDKLPSELEPAFVRDDELKDASASRLYLAALASYYDQQPEHFDPTWSELMERFPDFAAGYGLRAEQVQTLWELPNDKRQARVLNNLRKAHERDEASVLFLLRLSDWLRKRKSDSEEARELLEVARAGAFVEAGEGEGDRRLRNIKPLNEWADYLSDQGWSESSEKAWKHALDVAPMNCRAARELHQLYASRSYYPPLDEITSEWERCVSLERYRIFDRPDRQEERLQWYRGQARRYPYNSSDQINYAREVRAQGDPEKALEILRRARDRMPWSDGIWNQIAEVMLVDEGREEAIGVLKKAIEENGSSSFLLRRMATMKNEIPLRELMRDGRKAVLEHVEGKKRQKAAPGGKETADEAYYLIDYAARKYEPNGSSQTLTHTVVRAMTKGAIDRFGETSIPRDAHLLLARTINQDGSVQVPERTAGKSSLSMPGLDEGDFVELAYVQYDSPASKSKSHVEGLRFYFQMSDISSVHSEFAIVGEHDGEFLRKNRAPKAKSYRKAGHEGVHFVREDSPRPRGEPYTPNGTEYLPWIQFYRKGVELDPFDVDRRYETDTVLGSLEISTELRRGVAKWREGAEKGSKDEIRQLFYKVTDWVTSPDPDAFGRDVAHTYASKEGSPHLLLHTAYQLAGIESDVFIAKSKYQNPDEFPVQEFAKYGNPLVRVKMPDGGYVWLHPAHPDAMFNVINLSTMGQPAVCVTCEDLVEKEIPTEGFRNSAREVDIEGELSVQGDLTGHAEITFNGIRAASVRASLRRTPQTTRRRKFLDRVINGLLPGSSLTEFEIRGETDHDEPLVIEIDFERPDFARASSSGTLRVQTALFREPVASAYAKLQSRARPLMIGRQRQTNYSLALELPDGVEPMLESRSGKWNLDSDWGDFERNVQIEEGTLEVDSKLKLPIQRISTDRYRPFRAWAVQVEQSSRLLLTLRR